MKSFLRFLSAAMLACPLFAAQPITVVVPLHGAKLTGPMDANSMPINHVSSLLWGPANDVTLERTGASTLTLTGNLVTTGSSGAASLTLSGLTATRVPFAGTAGLLVDSSVFTFSSGTGVLSATGFSGAFNGSLGQTTPAAARVTTLGVSGVITAGSSNTTLTDAEGLILSSALNIVVGGQGGTGVANTGKTITLGGNLTTSGAFSTTLTSTGNTVVTLPTTGTLATLSGSEALSNKTVNKVAITTPATGATITVADNKTLTVNNTLTFSGTDNSTLSVGAGGTLGNAAYVSIGTAAGTVAAGDDSRIVAGGTALQPSGSGAGLTGITASQVGALATNGTAADVNPTGTSISAALSAKAPLVSPAFTTPNIGAATGTSLVLAEPLIDRGLTWRNSPLPSGSSLNRSIVFAGNNFVMWSGSHLFITSDGGMSWENIGSQSFPFDPDSSGNIGCYGDGLLLIGGTMVSSGQLVVGASYDQGRTWSHIIVEASYSYTGCIIGGITYHNGTFILIDTYGLAWRSTNNGATWTSVNLPSSSARVSSATNGKLVAVAYNTGDKLYTSLDGITWNTVTLSESLAWVSMTYGNGVFVAVGPANKVLTSSDGGVTWVITTLTGTAHTWKDVVYGNGLFIAGANTGTNRVMYSKNGIVWTEVDYQTAIHHLAYGRGVFIAAQGTINAAVTGSVSNVSNAEPVVYRGKRTFTETTTFLKEIAGTAADVNPSGTSIASALSAKAPIVSGTGVQTIGDAGFTTLTNRTYASMYIHSGVTEQTGVATSFVKITQFNTAQGYNGLTNDATADKAISRLTATRAGTYRIWWSASIISDVNNSTVTAAVFANGAEMLNTSTSSTAPSPAAGKKFQIGSQGTVALGAGQHVELYAKSSEAGGVGLTLTECNISMERIGN